MANSYPHLAIQIILAVRNPKTISILDINKVKIKQYIWDIIKNANCIPISIYLDEYHLHFLVNQHPTVFTHEIISNIKFFSEQFINSNNLTNGYFEWHSGFYVRTYYGQSKIDDMRDYIENQAKYHEKVSFKEEYMELVKVFEIDFDKEHLFD